MNTLNNDKTIISDNVLLFICIYKRFCAFNDTSTILFFIYFVWLVVLRLSWSAVQAHTELNSWSWIEAHPLTLEFPSTGITCRSHLSVSLLLLFYKGNIYIKKTLRKILIFINFHEDSINYTSQVNMAGDVLLNTHLLHVIVVKRCITLSQEVLRRYRFTESW